MKDDEKLIKGIIYKSTIEEAPKFTDLIGEGTAELGEGIFIKFWNDGSMHQSKLNSLKNPEDPYFFSTSLNGAKVDTYDLDRLPADYKKYKSDLLTKATKALKDSLKKDSNMKKYKIGNKIITADSPTKALEIHKLLDSKMKDDNLYETIKGILNDLIYKKNYTVYDALIRLYKFYPEVDASMVQKALAENKHSVTKQFVERFGFSDSLKDESIEELSEEEKKAIEDYKRAIAETNDPKMLKLFAHILKEETEHLEELQTGEMEDSLSNDIKKYQEWVDYDMKKYGRISEKTNHELDKAGLEVVKDKYGSYEVIARD